MRDPAIDMLEFIYSIPPSVNPYAATAERVKELGRGGRPVLVGRIIRRIICFQFIIVICQAIAVLWLRSRGNKLRFFRYNKLGLFHVELLNEVVLLMLLYSVCAFSDLVTQDLVQNGHLRFSNKMFLHTGKFIFSAAVSCRADVLTYTNGIREVFLWILGIESVMNLTSLGARARTGASIKLSGLKRFVLNGLLVAVVAVPGEVEDTSDQVVEALYKGARTWRADTYSSLQLLQLLKPTEGFHARSKHVIDNIKFMILLYAGQHCVIAVLYIPTSIILLRSLRQQCLTGTSVMKGTTSGGTAVSDRSNPLLQVRKRLINQAYLIHLEELLHLPPVIYLYIGIQGTAYYADPTWILIDEINTLYTTRAEQKSNNKPIPLELPKPHEDVMVNLEDTKSTSTFQPAKF
ncbi:hypothetical protein PTTG_12124 [Puccinia triticina 1-1 BBBD Race 1]|uniref:Uncharacterized protein n=1 Tax=Puccinia triticina (isolate 1-1 / race 1 (BBBD)) TaxID=630390 RepID=A0A180GHY4_PUCT1|nr:hypothetical protein PTTG_12124 [Puccinia triticina 1-1 BBBD Race 1]